MNTLPLKKLYIDRAKWPKCRIQEWNLPQNKDLLMLPIFFRIPFTSNIPLRSLVDRSFGYSENRYFHNLALQSPLPVAKWGSPAGLTATLITKEKMSHIKFFVLAPEFLCPCSTIIEAALLFGSQNMTEWSFDPEMIHFPSGENATERTKSCKVLNGIQ